ncbi:MAG: helix-turn-helix domain-containing protein [Pseudomonadota bacterium]
MFIYSISSNSPGFQVLSNQGLMQLLIKTIVQGSCTSASKLSIGRKHALNALETSIDHWMEDPGGSLRVSDIESISQRVLEMASREVYGVTPHGWFKLARLNAAYRELCSGNSESVTDVCIKLGFNHMGRFAGEYRALFDECPRETIQRRQPCAHQPTI